MGQNVSSCGQEKEIIDSSEMHHESFLNRLALMLEKDVSMRILKLLSENIM